MNKKYLIYTIITTLLLSAGLVYAAVLFPSQGGTGTSLIPSKGKLLVGTSGGLYTTLSVGSNEQILTVDSTQTYGVKWATVSAGTVTSVAMTVPTGLSISGSPITTAGTLALSLTSGYNIPKTASTTEWATAYGWGDHSIVGYFPLTTWYATTTHKLISSLPSLSITKSQVSDFGTYESVLTFNYPLSRATNAISTVATSSLNLLVNSFLSPNISQWTNNSNYLTAVASDADWTVHASYPAACGAGQYISALGDISTCGTPTNTTYTATYPITLTGTAFGIIATSSMAINTDNLVQGSTNLFNQTHTGDVTGSVGLTIAATAVHDSMIDFGTGAGQVNTADVSELTNLYYTDARVNAYIHASTTIPKLYTANTFVPLQIFGNASSTLFSTFYASSTNYYGANLANCTGKLLWSNGQFSCGTDASGSGVGTVSTSTSPTMGNLAYWTSKDAWPETLGSVATSTITCGGTVSCTSGAYIIGSALTITGAGGGTVGTSTNETKGYIPYWTSTAGTPALLGQVATTSMTCTSPLSCGTFDVLTGGGAITLGTIPISKGGTNLTSYASGDILYASAANTLSALTKGTDGQLLTLSSGFPSWGSQGFSPAYPSFTYATSTTWTGTTTVPLGAAYVNETWIGAKCFTNVGTLNVDFYDGTDRMGAFNASTTIGTITLSTNNTFTAGETRYVDVGTPATAPTKISCTVYRSFTGSLPNYGTLNYGLADSLTYFAGAGHVATGTTHMLWNDTANLFTITGNASTTQLTTTNSTYLATSGGSVGIGTTTPAAKLEISANSENLRLSNSVAAGAAVWMTMVGGSSSGKYNWMIAKDVINANALQIVPSTATDGTTFSTPAVTILSTGNVGIGTTTPGMKFSVQGDALADSWNVYSKMFIGDAITQLKGIKMETGQLGEWVNVDHDTLPIGILKNIPMTYEKIIPAYKTATTTEEVSWNLQAMDISALTQMNTQAILQLETRIKELENKCGIK